MLFTWFTEKSIPSDSLYAIVDDYGITYIDTKYRNTGISEGWLMFHKYWWNEYGESVILYRPE